MLSYFEIDIFLEECVLNEENHRSINNDYIIHLHDNSWELTCANTSKSFITSCSLNGSWENVHCEEDNTTYLGSGHTELSRAGTKMASFSMAVSRNTETVKNHNSQDFENPTIQVTNNFSIIVAASITSVGIVLIVISILLIAIPTRMRRKYHHDNCYSNYINILLGHNKKSR